MSPVKGAPLLIPYWNEWLCELARNKYVSKRAAPLTELGRSSVKGAPYSFRIGMSGCASSAETSMFLSEQLL
jgi:hypothetical protein